MVSAPASNALPIASTTVPPKDADARTTGCPGVRSAYADGRAFPGRADSRALPGREARVYRGAKGELS